MAFYDSIKGDKSEGWKVKIHKGPSNDLPYYRKWLQLTITPVTKILGKVIVPSRSAPETLIP